MQKKGKKLTLTKCKIISSLMNKEGCFHAVILMSERNIFSLFFNKGINIEKLVHTHFLSCIQKQMDEF